MPARRGWRRGVAVELIVEVRRHWRGDGGGEVMLTRQGGSETMPGANFIFKPVILYEANTCSRLEPRVLLSSPSIDLYLKII